MSFDRAFRTDYEYVKIFSWGDNITKNFQAIYEMLGPEVTKSADDSPRKRAKMIFEKMDVNNDKELTLKEFVDGCLADKELFQILTNEVKK